MYYVKHISNHLVCQLNTVETLSLAVNTNVKNLSFDIICTVNLSVAEPYLSAASVIFLSAPGPHTSQ